jgi:hypothetical protein
MIESLLIERDGYLRRGLMNRVAQVDAELARYGIAVEQAAEAAVTGAAERAVAPKRARRGDG